MTLQEEILQAGTGEFLFVVALAVISAVAAFYYGFRFFRLARMVEDVPTSTVRSAAQGFVELAGHAEQMAGEPIIAPLSGQNCVWFSYTVERREQTFLNGRRRTHWRTIDSGVSEHLFYLNDGSGRCVIDPDGAEVIPSFSRTWSGSRDRPEKWDLSSGSGFVLGSLISPVGRYRYHEKRIHAGDPLYALGFFKTVGGDDGTDTEANEVRDLLRRWKKDPEWLRQQFDLDGDGEINPAEWSEARKQAGKEVALSRRRRGHQSELNLLKKPDHGDHHFLLSVIPESKLRWRYRIKSAASLLFFLGLSAALAWAVQLRFGG